MDFSKKFVLAAETVSEYTVQKGEERHRMMIFDGHSDLLYDVTRRRLAGEDHVLERRHLPGLRADWGCPCGQRQRRTVSGRNTPKRTVGRGRNS